MILNYMVNVQLQYEFSNIHFKIINIKSTWSYTIDQVLSYINVTYYKQHSNITGIHYDALKNIWLVNCHTQSHPKSYEGFVKLKETSRVMI